MSRCLAAAMALATFIGLESGLFAQQPIRAQLPTYSMLGRYGLELAWWGHATMDPHRDRIQFFTSDEQQTFVQSDSGMVTSFDNATGHRLWSVQVGAITDVRFSLVSNEQFALVVSGDTVYMLDKRTGNVVTELKVPSAPATSPGIDDTNVYVGCQNGIVYAYGLKTVAELVKTAELKKYSYRILSWQYRTGGRVGFQPVSTGTVVCIPSNDGSLYGLTVAKRKVVFQFETNKGLSAPICQIGSQLYLATEDLKLYSVSADTGILRWELLTGWHVTQTPRIIDKELFIRPEGHGMYCLDATNGRQIWGSPRAGNFLSATPAIVYVSDDFGNVLLLNRKDGRLVGSFSLAAFPVRISNDHTDRIYCASTPGLVICLRERDREFPLFHKHPEQRPVLPEVAPDDGDQKGGVPAKKSDADAKDDAKDAKEDAKGDKKDADTTSGATEESSDQTPAPASRKPAKSK